MMQVNQRKLMERVAELVADGYLLRGAIPEIIILTPKGLAALMEAAERPINRSDLVKENLQSERERTERSNKTDGK